MRFKKEKKMRNLYILLMVSILVASTREVKNRLKSSIGQTGHQKLIKNASNTLQNLNVGMIVPHTNFKTREYTKAINSALSNLNKGDARTKNQSSFSFLNKYHLQVSHRMMKLTPSPTGKYFRGRLNFKENRLFCC